MLVKEIFENLYNHSIDKDNDVWNLVFESQNDIVLKAIEEHFQEEIMMLFKMHNASEKVVPIIHLHLDDIIKWKHLSTTNQDKEIFSYLQLTCAICATTQLNFDGEFIYCFDIFMKSVFDKTFKNGEQYDLKDIEPYRFLDSKRVYLANSKSVIEQWFSQLYYYSKSFSGLNEWRLYFFEEVYYQLNDDFKLAPYHPQFLSNLLSWCEINFNTIGSHAIRKIIAREYHLIAWSADLNKNITKSSLGLQLLLCKNYKNEEKLQLYSELNKYGLDPSFQIQLKIAICYKEEYLIEHINSLINAIKTYNKFLYYNNFNTIDYIYHRARLFKLLLGTPISIAFDISKSEIIEDILSAFYDIKIPQKKGTTLFIIPNQLNKVAYCFDNKLILDEKDVQGLLIKIVDTENSAFNLRRILKGGIKQNIPQFNRLFGVPNPKIAKEYETNLFELYNFKVIKDFLKDNESLCQFDFNSTPLQALMIKSIQKTLPINLSLSKKLEFTTTKNVLFWYGFSQTSEIEKEALQIIFENANINFEVHSEENSSLSKFTQRINDSNPDIIWISSHGEHEHYEPNISSIKLSENESIGIRDFYLLINKEEKRRLIFLNICEGGVHTQTGEFKNLGFPNLLTAHNQDVISHLWMAEPRFSYVFGAFFALGIAILQKDFFEAFEYSLSKVLSNKESIIDEITAFDLDLSNLRERIENNDGTEWGNIITTGSPVYNI